MFIKWSFIWCFKQAWVQLRATGVGFWNLLTTYFRLGSIQIANSSNMITSEGNSLVDIRKPYLKIKANRTRKMKLLNTYNEGTVFVWQRDGRFVQTKSIRLWHFQQFFLSFNIVLKHNEKINKKWWLVF